MFLCGITFTALWLCPLVDYAAWIPMVNLCLQIHAFSPIWIYQTSSVKKMGTSSQKRFNIERDSGASKPSKGPKDKEQGRALQAFRKPRVDNLQIGASTLQISPLPTHTWLLHLLEEYKCIFCFSSTFQTSWKRLICGLSISNSASKESGKCSSCVYSSCLTRESIEGDNDASCR